MTPELPRLLERGQLADLCRETAARETVQPELVEKDHYLTRLLWSLGARLGARLLLKGGTLLSKVDLGFLRMSEDADFVLAVPQKGTRGSNARQLHVVRDALKTIAPAVGMTTRFPGGAVQDRGRHAVWELRYPSEFGSQSIRLEVSIRPTLRPPRQVDLKQLLTDPLVGDYSAAFCWALRADEARAEKVRAAFTRDAVRDFYDLGQLAEAGADFGTRAFIDLVSTKLEEVGVTAVQTHTAVFGLTRPRLRRLRIQAGTDLPGVLRRGAPPFDLDAMLKRFSRLWGLPLPAE